MAERGWNLRGDRIPRAKGEQHANWKGDAASNSAKRKRARRRFPLGPCEECGKPGVERHHKDGDEGNNVPENIQILCRRCHMTIDGRLERLAEVRPNTGRQTKA